MGTPTLIVVRHSATKYDPPVAKDDIIAGWQDLPLAPEGRAEAKRIGEAFKDKPIARIWSTDLQRGADTAAAISKGNTRRPLVMETKSLRPQNVGELNNRKEKDVHDDLIFYQVEAPTRAIPGGESFETHTNRLLPFLQDRLESVKKRGSTEVIVTHSRNFPIIHGWHKAGMNGTDVDTGPIKKDAEIGVGHAIVFTWSGEAWALNTMKT